MTRTLKLPAHLLALNPELASATAALPGRQRVSNADKAPLFAWAWKVTTGEELWAQSEWRFHPVREWRYDWAFVAEMVSVEVDGGQSQAGGGWHNTDADRLKINSGASMGWLVLRFSVTALESDPAGCVELVQAALALRGKDGAK